MQLQINNYSAPALAEYSGRYSAVAVPVIKTGVVCSQALTTLKSTRHKRGPLR